MLEKYKDILKKVILFKGLELYEIDHLMNCLDGTIKKYDKGNYVVREGDEIKSPGIVLSGRAEIIKENLAGNKAIVSFLSPTQIFGEVIVCTEKKKSIVSVVATEATEILYIDFEKVINRCGKNCGYHTRLISNMMRVIAEKNMSLNTKMDYLLIKNMREKLATFLYKRYKENNSLSFNINLNRNELAAYLNVSRASMCRELSRMKEEGIIDYYKDGFKILDLQKLRNEE